MGLISSKLDQIESRLKILIEGRLAGLFPVQQVRDDLSQRLVSAMQEGSKNQVDGGPPIAPDNYVILTSQQQAAGFLQNVPLLHGLAKIIHEVGSDAGLIFSQKPVVNVAPDHELQTDEIVVIAHISEELLEQTLAMSSDNDEVNTNIPANAFLIVNGVQVYVLEHTLVNIGRRSDNDLIIDDPRISRAHSQLRAIRGNFVIFDLDSKGGTFVNGKRISQCTLHPRDVISLAGLPLVYGQDDANLGETQQYMPSSPSQADSPTKDSQT